MNTLPHARPPPAMVASVGAAPTSTELARQCFAVVLAGGRGTRLGPLTAHRCKPALPFAGQLAIIDFTLSNCVNSDVRRIAVLTQYKAQSLIRHLGRGWRFLDVNLGEFIDIVPAQQQRDEHWYIGTADAVRQNLSLLRETRARHVLVLAGDHAYKMDYGRMLADHVASGLPASVACLELPLDGARGFGVLQLDALQRVIAFEEKPERPSPLPQRPDRACVSMGVYAFDAEFLQQQLENDAVAAGSGHDFGSDLLPRLAASRCLFAHRFERSSVRPEGAAPYWRDVGTLDAYYEANMDMTQPQPQLDLYDDNWPIRSLQRQLPPARFVHDNDGRPGMALDSLVCGGCVVRGAQVRGSVLSSKVQIGPGSEIESSLLLPCVQTGRDVRLRRCIVDLRCILPDELCAGFDAEADAARFHRTPGGVVLITPEMLAA